MVEVTDKALAVKCDINITGFIMFSVQYFLCYNTIIHLNCFQQLFTYTHDVTRQYSLLSFSACCPECASYYRGVLGLVPLGASVLAFLALIALVIHFKWTVIWKGRSSKLSCECLFISLSSLFSLSLFLTTVLQTQLRGLSFSILASQTMVPLPLQTKLDHTLPTSPQL